MRIADLENNLSIGGSSCKITKIMTDILRKMGEIKIEFDFTGNIYSEKAGKDFSLLHKELSCSLFIE